MAAGPDAEVETWFADTTASLRARVHELSADQRALFESLARTAPAGRRPGGGRPLFDTPDPDHAHTYLRSAVDGLAERRPHQSSRRLLGRRAGWAAGLFGLANLALALVWPVPLAVAWIALATAAYVAVIVDRVVLAVRSTADGAMEVVSDEEARAVPDADLPVFTILVPAYREPEVIAHLLRAVGRLEYPADKLEVKLLLEADDHETIAAATSVDVDLPVDVVLVPPAEPRTKPKALNFGLHLAGGDIVTVYDAEDVPDPLQLRRAAVVLDRHGPEVACVQAQLSFSNAGQNVITRWFTLEYAVWFELLLPGLVATGAPVPLGGTSNHFRRAALEELEAWDPFNVTEDADLGVRLHRTGHRTVVMRSVTEEEANSDFVNWVKQRSRWYKGYLQTWIVHMRHPLTLRRQLGWRGFGRFNLFVGGTPGLALVNPVFWGLTLLWFLGRPAFVRAIFPGLVFYPGLACWALGNFAGVYVWLVATRVTRRTGLVVAALTVPVYWVMMAVAAAKAALQLLLTPSYWEKTAHGLDRLAHPPT